MAPAAIAASAATAGARSLGRASDADGDDGPLPGAGVTSSATLPPFAAALAL